MLYPETKIVIASGTKSQSREVIEKIEEIRKESANLHREISDLRTSTNDAKVEFHNGSWIKVVASNDGARSKRANLLIVDEFRMVDFQVITKVLRKFLTAPRTPAFLSKPEYQDYPQERNKEIYLSSAWFKMHWSWDRLKSYFKSMYKGKNYFVAGLPYQLAVKERLLMKEQVEDEMSEADFDEIAWLMEMECLFFGESEKAFFNYEDIEKQRKIPKAIYPKGDYEYMKDRNFKYQAKKEGELRLVSCDIAGMAGKENDASVYTILKLTPTKTGYNRDIVYMESVEGGHTGDQANRIRQMFYDFDCDYVVLDTQNMGLGVFDNMIQPSFDNERNVEYPAWTCINDEKMADRCTYKDAQPRIFSVKGNQTFNSECAVLLKDGIRRGKVRFLSKENEAQDALRKVKGFDALTPEMKAHFEHPFRQVTALVNEMINLEGERTDSGLVKLKEPRSKRKDRYSSTSYGNYIASQLERDLLRDETLVDTDDELVYF